MRISNALFFSILTLLLFSCSKKEEDTSDIIHFTELNPDIEVHLKDSVVFDLDQNGISDIKIKSSSGKAECPGPRGSTIDITVNSIVILSENNLDAVMIATSKPVFGVCNFNNSQLIYDNSPIVLDWRNYVPIEVGAICGSGGIFFVNETFIGVKINGKFGYIHVWPMNNYGIKILDYAINQRKGQDIFGGQKH